MTKKHYIVLAAHYRTLITDAASTEIRDALSDMVKLTAIVLKDENKNFDIDRFLAACTLSRES